LTCHNTNGLQYMPFFATTCYILVRVWEVIILKPGRSSSVGSISITDINYGNSLLVCFLAVTTQCGYIFHSPVTGFRLLFFNMKCSSYHAASRSRPVKYRSCPVRLYRVTVLASVFSFVLPSACGGLSRRAASPTFSSYGALLAQLFSWFTSRILVITDHC
jgi:hypothetical protein